MREEGGGGELRATISSVTGWWKSAEFGQSKVISQTVSDVKMYLLHQLFSSKTFLLIQINP